MSPTPPRRPPSDDDVDKIKRDDEKLSERIKPKEIEKVKADKEQPEKFKSDKEQPEKFKSDKEQPEKFKSDKEQPEKFKSDKEFENKFKPDKELEKVKDDKEFEKAAPEKLTREVSALGLPGEPPGGLDPAALLAHADSLEQTARQLRHFIERSMRPDLSTGALRNEEDLPDEPAPGQEDV